MKRLNMEASTKARFVLVLVLFAVTILGFPLVKGLGVSFGYGEQEAVVAQAELLTAQAELSRARAEVYKEFSASLDALPQALSEAGRVSLQIGLAVVTILLGIGGLAFILALAHHVYVVGRIKADNAQYQLQGAAMYAPVLPNLPRENSPVDDVIDGSGVDWVGLGDYTADESAGNGPAGSK